MKNGLKSIRDKVSIEISVFLRKWKMILFFLHTDCSEQAAEPGGFKCEPQSKMSVSWVYLQGQGLQSAATAPSAQLHHMQAGEQPKSWTVHYLQWAGQRKVNAQGWKKLQEIQCRPWLWKQVPWDSSILFTWFFLTVHWRQFTASEGS